MIGRGVRLSRRNIEAMITSLMLPVMLMLLFVYLFGGASLIAGHVVASVIRNAVSSLLVFGVALSIGFRPHASAAQWLGVAGLLLAFMAAVSWLAATVGMLAGTPEGASGFTFVVMF